MQYMEGQSGRGGAMSAGDPAMALVVSPEQYLTSYLFHAPPDFEVSYVNVTEPMGATVLLDGAAVGGFMPVGGSGFGVAKVELDSGGNGNHAMSSDQPFGISVYGYGQYTSYWFAGGFKLPTFPIE